MDGRRQIMQLGEKGMSQQIDELLTDGGKENYQQVQKEGFMMGAIGGASAERTGAQRDMEVGNIRSMKGMKCQLG
jgi:hypothetical protein